MLMYFKCVIFAQHQTLKIFIDLKFPLIIGNFRLIFKRFTLLSNLCPWFQPQKPQLIIPRNLGLIISISNIIIYFWQSSQMTGVDRHWQRGADKVADLVRTLVYRIEARGVHDEI
jgi:protein-S-isoprenylcysteine O-methyltransferase Ste14